MQNPETIGPGHTEAEGGVPPSDAPSPQEPIFNIPPMAMALLVAMFAVMACRWVLSQGADVTFVLALALIPARFAGYAAELPGGAVAIYTQFITHMFVHADAMHLAFNSASLLAFAGVLEKRIGAVRILLMFIVCGIAGAATFIAFNSGLLAPMIGASGAIAGLMGGVMRLFFSSIDQTGGLRQLNESPLSVTLAPLSAALRDRRLLLVTAAFVIMNVAAMIGLGDINAGGNIAWEAHIGGYFAGLLFFSYFDVAARHEKAPE